MKRKTVRYRIDGRACAFRVEGDVEFGGDEVLLDRDDNLFAGTRWDRTGYAVRPFLPARDYEALRAGMRGIVASALSAAGLEPPPDFRLESYHALPGMSEAVHARVVRTIQNCFPISRFPIDPRAVSRRVSAICGVRVDVNPAKPLFCVRIVRPDSIDNNPPHRDVWLDRLRNAVNLYAPIAGSSRLSSLALIPGSHYWKESDIERTVSGARVKRIRYTVPAVTGSRQGLRMIRPNPRENEALLFSPYLIHGGAVNLSRRTRVSLEMRFWRVRRRDAR